MIRASHLTLRRGTNVLLEDTDFVINPGERLGLVGRNGAGKSSLFALLQGSIDADAGSLDMPAAWHIASVEQEVAATDRPAREFVIDGDTRLRTLQAERAATDDAHGEQIAELELQLEQAGAWTAASRAEQLLHGLGFAASDWMRPVSHFSGGWRMRLSLARALMAPSDLLLLDEPTNHLDLDAMLWLERWLGSYAGTVVLISHDTEFLDAVARSVLHFDHGKLVRYRGGYQDFVVQHAERERQHQAAWARQTRETAHLQQFIDRFKAKASKAKQAQSRVKALARMQELAPLRGPDEMNIRLPKPDHSPDPLIRLVDVGTGYTDDDRSPRPILRGIDLMLRAGSRIGILGVNGAGKSTLVKTLAGLLPVQAGEMRVSKGVEIGYFAQHQVDMLDVEGTPLTNLAKLAPELREQDLRNYLGSFGFSGESAKSPVGPMSGGEKARLALSLIVWRKPNLLLLDEPSNHLDVQTREALAFALTEFEGSVLLVSHDRHLLRTTVDAFWIVADGQVQEFDGDLDDYRDWLRSRDAQQRQGTQADRDTAGEANPEGTVDRKTQRRLQAQARQQLALQRKPLEKTLARVEIDMDKVRARLQALDTQIADPEFYSEARRQERQQSLTEHGELSKQMEALEEQWLTLQTDIEALTLSNVDEGET